jgi:hypothetical protein
VSSVPSTFDPERPAELAGEVDESRGLLRVHLGPGPAEDDAAEHRERRRGQPAGEQGEARLGGRVAEQRLREQREQERAAEQAEAEHHEQEDARREVAVLEHAQVDHRVRVAPRQLPPATKGARGAPFGSS